MVQIVEYLKQFGHFQRSARLYLISTALSGVTAGIILVLYNLYLAELGYGTDFIGLVLLIATIGGGLAIFPAGLCIDRFGGKAILIWSSGLLGLAGMGQILFRMPLPLFVSGFVAGIAGAFMLVINAPFLSQHSTPIERPHLFSLNIVLALATTVIGETLGGILPQWLHGLPWLMVSLPPAFNWMLASEPTVRSYQLALLFAGMIAAPSFIPLFLMSDDRPQIVVDVATRRRNVLEPVYKLWLVIIAWRRRPWREVLGHPLVCMLVVQILIWTGAGLFIPYFNLYFVKHLGASPALFGAIDGVANLFNACLILLAPWLALRIGKVATMTITRLASVPLMLIIGFTGSLPVAALLYPLRQGLMDMSQGILQVFSMEVVNKEHRGLANSSYQASYQVAYALAAPLGGLLIAHVGYTAVFMLAAVLYLFAIGLLWGRFKSRDDVQEPEAILPVKSEAL